MKKMLLSAVLMSMLALGITTSTEASPFHHNPHSSFHSVHQPPMHQPNHDHFRTPHVPNPHNVRPPRHEKFQQHHVSRSSRSSHHRYPW